MIREIIDFAEYCGAGTGYYGRKRDNQVIIIKTKEEVSRVSYDSAETVTDDKKLRAFLNLLNDLNVPKEPNGFKNWLITEV